MIIYTDWLNRDNREYYACLRYILFRCCKYKTVIDGVYALINLMTERFFCYDEVLYFPRSIEGMRKHLIKLENKVRKRR